MKGIWKVGLLAGLLAAELVLFSKYAYSAPVETCPYANQEQRILDELAAEPGRVFHILTDHELENFKKHLAQLNGHDLPIDKVYVIQSTRPGVVHLFMLQSGCIWFYQATLERAVQALIADEPVEGLVHA